MYVGTFVVHVVNHQATTYGTKLNNESVSSSYTGCGMGSVWGGGESHISKSIFRILEFQYLQEFAEEIEIRVKYHLVGLTEDLDEKKRGRKSSETVSLSETWDKLNCRLPRDYLGAHRNI